MDADGALERELKFPCTDLSALRERLVELGAERFSTSALEDNWIFDRGGELAAAGTLLRLRRDSGGARLTFKGPARYEEAVKVRIEHESRVDDEAATRRILESLGYEARYRYQKFREEWRVGGVSVSLDHTPIGDYVEFEGEGAAKVARRCGLAVENAEPRNYLRLYRDYRREHPQAPRDMVFP